MERQVFFNALADIRERYLRRNWYYYADQQRLLRFLIPPGASVLELGCGTGVSLAALPNRIKVGIDFAERMLNRARTSDHSGTEYRQDDIEDLSESRTFDYVLLLDTIGSLLDVQKALHTVRERVCSQDTRLIITSYNFLWEPLLKLATLLHRKTPMPEQNWFSRSDVRNLLILTDFEVVKEGERLLLPIGIPLLANLCNRILAHLPLLRRFCLSYYLVARPLPRQRREYSVSVVIPARNESGNIERALQTMPHFGRDLEVVFVEGHSTDDTWRVIGEVASRYRDRFAIQVTQQGGRGKGDAVRKGFQLARNEVLMILDADLTVDPSELPKFYDAIASGKGEFINGSRMVYPMERQAMRILNLMGNKCFSLIFTWLLGQRLKDTLCGTKVLRKDHYERILANHSYFGDFDPFGDFDLLFGAAKQNLKIVEVPIRYRERRYGTTNISRFRHGCLLLRMCLFAARRIKFI